jgi:hypothetical protein
MADMKEKIQAYLDENEASLSESPQFKGLYVRKRRSM